MLAWGWAVPKTREKAWCELGVRVRALPGVAVAMVGSGVGRGLLGVGR
jgi:hypothetical protein